MSNYLVATSASATGSDANPQEEGSGTSYKPGAYIHQGSMSATIQDGQTIIQRAGVVSGSSAPATAGPFSAIWDKRTQSSLGVHEVAGSDPNSVVVTVPGIGTMSLASALRAGFATQADLGGFSPRSPSAPQAAQQQQQSEVEEQEPNADLTDDLMPPADEQVLSGLLTNVQGDVALAGMESFISSGVVDEKLIQQVAVDRGLGLRFGGLLPDHLAAAGRRGCASATGWRDHQEVPGGAREPPLAPSTSADPDGNLIEIANYINRLAAFAPQRSRR